MQLLRYGVFPYLGGLNVKILPVAYSYILTDLLYYIYIVAKPLINNNRGDEYGV